MNTLRKFGAALVALCLLVSAALAADPSGTWKFPTPGDGSSAESTLVLAMEDGKLSGTITSPGRGGRDSSVKLASASIKGDVVSFTVQRTVQKQRVVTRYSGRLEGDRITGTVEGPWGSGGSRETREWVAKRSM